MELTRGLMDAPEEAQPQSDVPTNEEVLDFMDQLALLVRDLDTRLSTLERHLLAPREPENRIKGL